MQKEKLILPVTILLASIVLGGFFYASQISKQESIERQQPFDLSQRRTFEPEKNSTTSTADEKIQRTVNVEEQNEKASIDHDKRSLDVVETFLGKDLSLASEITCKYPQILNGNYSNNTITHSLPEPEKNPIIFTFSQLNNEVGNLSFIDATQSITSVSILKFIDDNEKIVYIEGNGEIGSYLTIHTIYKKFGVSTYVKNINLLGTIPLISSAIGSCSITSY